MMIAANASCILESWCDGVIRDQRIAFVSVTAPGILVIALGGCGEQLLVLIVVVAVPHDGAKDTGLETLDYFQLKFAIHCIGGLVPSVEGLSHIGYGVAAELGIIIVTGGVMDRQCGDTSQGGLPLPSPIEVGLVVIGHQVDLRSEPAAETFAVERQPAAVLRTRIGNGD